MRLEGLIWGALQWHSSSALIEPGVCGPPPSTIPRLIPPPPRGLECGVGRLGRFPPRTPIFLLISPSPSACGPLAPTRRGPSPSSRTLRHPSTVVCDARLQRKRGVPSPPLRVSHSPSTATPPPARAPGPRPLHHTPTPPDPAGDPSFPALGFPSPPPARPPPRLRSAPGSGPLPPPPPPPGKAGAARSRGRCS